MQNTPFFRFAQIIVILSSLLMAIAMANGQTAGLVKVMGYFGVAELIGDQVLRLLSATGFVLLAFGWATVFWRPQARRSVAIVTLIVAIVPLISLFGSQHWIASLGGFPAIGSGQGIIKYAALAALALTLWQPVGLRQRHLIWLNYLPVALVLLWIGGMKFTALEAKGIEDLVATSPLMAWMYSYFSVQTASNIIGVYDLIALVVLGLGLKYPGLFWLGIAMTGAVFVTTQTFLFSFPGSLTANGVLTSTGVFIIKDLWYLGNLAILIGLCRGQGQPPWRV